MRPVVIVSKYSGGSSECTSLCCMEFTERGLKRLKLRGISVVVPREDVGVFTCTGLFGFSQSSIPYIPLFPRERDTVSNRSSLLSVSDPHFTLRLSVHSTSWTAATCPMPRRLALMPPSWAVSESAPLRHAPSAVDERLVSI